MNKFISVFAIVIALGMVSACSNTMEGVRKDSKPVGDALNEAADNIRKKIHEATE